MCGCNKHSTAADRAAMCLACRACSRTTDADGQLWTCSVSGRPIADHIVRRARCPKGRHPSTRDGVLRWLGARWYGVPMPVRLALWAFQEDHPRPSRFTGCGCLKRAKDWWGEKLQSGKAAKQQMKRGRKRSARQRDRGKAGAKQQSSKAAKEGTPARDPGSYLLLCCFAALDSPVSLPPCLCLLFLFSALLLC